MANGPVDSGAPPAACPPARRASLPDLRSLLDAVDCLVLDCDGVVWRGDRVVPGIPETLAALRAAGKRLRLCTNNSTRSRAGYVQKCVGMGIEVQQEEILCSSFAAAVYLRSVGLEPGSRVYVVGEAGISEELAAAGFTPVGGPDDSDKAVGPGRVEHDQEVRAVVVGLDRRLSYHKLTQASLCLRCNPGCLLVATNDTGLGLFTEGQEWPGAGAMVAAVQACSGGREPVVVGKPNTFMLDSLAKELGLPPRRMCMVGDRLATDVLFGQRGGLRTLLVLTGGEQEADVVSPVATIRADLYTASLADLLPALPAA